MEGQVKTVTWEAHWSVLLTASEFQIYQEAVEEYLVLAFVLYMRTPVYAPTYLSTHVHTPTLISTQPTHNIPHAHNTHNGNMHPIYPYLPTINAFGFSIII